MNELLKQLNINNKNIKDIDDKATIVISSYDEAALIYNKLENSDLVTKNSDESYLDIDDSKIVYEGDDFDLILELNMAKDIYKMTIMQVNEEDN